MSSSSTQELLARIRDLELENMALKSKLDQYQSIFNVDPGGGLTSVGGAAPPGGASATAPAEPSRARRTNRGVGISAEPQSLRTLKDLTNKTFPEFKKSDK
jgi:hypothetical protein